MLAREHNGPSILYPVRVSTSNADLIAAWQDQPAPLLPVLHAFYERDGCLNEEALTHIADALKIPLALLHGTVEFYHHISSEPGSRDKTRICDGPICRLNAGEQIIAATPGAVPMACAGRCDDPVPALRGGDGLVASLTTDSGTPGFHRRPSPLPAANPGNFEECCFAHIREPQRSALEGYQRTGGYEGLARARSLDPADVLKQLEASGLCGRGGAGFPTAVKWRAVRDAPGGPKTLVCNADEGEPGCFKDRALLDHDPHAILEGLAIAAHATGATRAFIYLRYEYPQTHAILEQAITEAGTELLGLPIWVRRGAGAYICGEETSLLNSLEGKHPFPRNRPPFPVTHGYEQTPTAVNNVETLASVGPILRHGPDWYAGLGLGEHKGTKLISLSGDVLRPGNYEVPMGLPLQTLLSEWGGLDPQHSIQAVTMAGLAGGFLGASELDVTLDEPSIRARGSFLGAGGIMVFNETRDMFEIARQAMAFFAAESCGKCFPCRIGTQRLTERLTPCEGSPDADTWRQEVSAIGHSMTQMSACGLGQGAPLITKSLMRIFPDLIDERLATP